MTRLLYLTALLGLLLLIAACGPEPEPIDAVAVVAPVVVETADPSPTAPAELVPPATATLTATPLPTATVTPPPTATAVPTQTAVPSPTASPTPDPWAAYTIATLAERTYGGGTLTQGAVIGGGANVTRSLFTYPSDDLTIHGFMDVPAGEGPFPVVLLLHGYVDPGVYNTVAYTQRYAAALAEGGYLVLHPNMRGFPPSDGGDDSFRTGLAIDVLNLIAIVRAQAGQPGPLAAADAEALHLWGHSMGGGVALRVAVVNNADYVRTAVLYGSMSGDETLNYERIREWSGGESGAFELSAPPEALARIEPIQHLDRLRAAIAVHHGTADTQVPIAWSEDLCARLAGLGRPAECVFYEGAPHTFYGAWDADFMAQVQAFFDAN